MTCRLFMLALILGVSRLTIRAAEPAPALTATNSPTAPAASAVATNSVSNPTNAATPAAGTNHFKTNHPFATVGALQLRSGFRLQLATVDPEVVNPVALAFDAAGRLFVAEQGESAEMGRIKLLEDENGDGQFETAKVFAERIPSPTALICYGSGVFVASGTQVLFLADTAGAGKATVRREIFGGFKPNGKTAAARITQFIWGLDNRIHAACVGLGGDILCLAMPTVQPLSLDGYDFAFDPRTLAMEREAGGNTLALGFDTAGRRFTCSTAQPVQFTLTDPFRASQNPLYLWPQLMTNLTSPQWQLFPLRPAPSTALADGNVIASRFVTNRFARPASLLIYRGGAFPKSWVDHAFIADPELRLITCQSLGQNGIVPALARPHSERTSEFLTTRDPAFRPVQIVAAPDGTLCVADLARSDLEQAGDRGRIWRILPSGMQPAKTPNLNALPSPALLELLGSANGWVRETAARLLYERGDAETLRTAAKELRWSWNPLTKLHLLHLLAAHSTLDESLLVRALRDKDEAVRENAVRLTARFVQDGNLPTALVAQLAANANDVSARVRYQVALTLGSVRHPAVAGMLTRALLRSPDDPLLQSAVLTGASADAADVLSRVVGNSRVGRSEASWAFLRQLAWMAGTQENAGLEDVLLDLQASGLNVSDQLILAREIGEGLHATGRTFVGGSVTNQWRGFAGRALAIALANNDPELRADAIRFLGVSGYGMREAGDWILALLVPGEPEAVQLAAVDALAHFADPRVTSAFVQRWSRLPASVQRAIIARMLEQFDRTVALLDAIQSGQIAAGALSDVQMNFLRTHRDRTTAERAVRIYGPVGQANLADRFTVALRLKGSPENGRRIFEQRCAGCHRVNEEGREFGPDLDDVADRSREQLLRDILEPSREVKPGFEAQVVQRTSDQLLFGLVTPSGNNHLLVRLPTGERLFLPRSQVDDTYKQDWSLMPADAAAGLSVTDLANLLAFLQAASTSR